MKLQQVHDLQWSRVESRAMIDHVRLVLGGSS